MEGAGGTTLFVRSAGPQTGDAIVLLHGYLFSSEVFVHQLRGPLAERYRLIAIDLRGHGRSGKPDEESGYLDAQAWADDVARVLDALELQRVVLVGWSMGARVALNYGWHYGFERITGLNLACALVAPADRRTGVALPPQLAGLLSNDHETRLRATREFVQSCSGGNALEPSVVDSFTRTAMATPVTARRASREWPILYVPTLRTLRTPVLVTHGSGDLLLAEAVSRELADLTPNSQLSVLGGAHLPFYLESEHFNRELGAFAATAFA